MVEDQKRGLPVACAPRQSTLLRKNVYSATWLITQVGPAPARHLRHRPHPPGCSWQYGAPGYAGQRRSASGRCSRRAPAAGPASSSEKVARLLPMVIVNPVVPTCDITIDPAAAARRNRAGCHSQARRCSGGSGASRPDCRPSASHRRDDSCVPGTLAR